MSASCCWRPSSEGGSREAAETGSRVLTATVVVHVVPRARTTEVAGRHGDALKIRVAAAPVDGAANEELVRFLAERLSVPRSAVTIAAGHAGRRKTVTIAGVETAAALRTLELENA